MGKIKHTLISYFSAFILVIVYGIYGTLIMSLIMHLKKYQVESSETAAIIVNAVISVTVVGILLIAKGSFGRITLKSFLQGIGLYALPMLIFLIFHFVEAIVWIFGENKNIYPDNINEIFTISLIYYISVAVTEEIVFRTAILNVLFKKRSLEKREVVVGCIYSGGLFGFIHIMNIFTDTKSDMQAKIFTILLACFIGFIFSVLYLKTQNILVTIALHFVWDFTSFWNGMMIREKYRYSGEYNFLIRQIFIIILMTIITIFLLYKSKSKDLTLCLKGEEKSI